MKFTSLKKKYTNNLKKIIRASKELLKIDKRSFVFLSIVEALFVLINFLSLLVLNSLFQSLSLARNLDYFSLVLKISLLYIFLLTLIKFKSSYINSYYLQFVLMPNFEEKFKIYMQNLSSNIDSIEFEDKKIYEKIYEASVSSTNIFRLVEIFIEKIALLINFFLISIFFMNISISYILLIVLSLSIGYLENRTRKNIINENRRKVYGSSLKKLQMSEILTRPAYVRDNEIYNLYSFLSSKVSSIYDEFEKISRKIYRDLFYKSSMLELLSSLLNICLYFYLFYRLILDRDYSNFAVSFFAIRMVFSASERYSELSSYQSIFINMTDPYFDFYKKYFDNQKSDLAEEFKNILELKDISFKYPNSNSYAIDRLNLKLESGKTYVIVGENGSGKTSLASIILGLYYPQEGDILYDGKKIDKLNTFYDKSAVFQNYARYPLSLAENINISDISKGRGEVVELLNKSDFLGYDYEKTLGKEVGEVNPSKGQWQQIAILRSIFRDRNIVVFDEPTNDIDPLKEKKIFDFLDSYKDKRTMVIISHKLLSVKLADEIIVMENGKIIQKESFERLKNQDGPFKKMWDAKSRVYKEGAEFEY